MNTSVRSGPLTQVERSVLASFEGIIERGLSVFYEVGNALTQIRDFRLYRLTHATFEEYCQERWGMVASRARQLISSAEVVSNLKSVTTVTLPANEAQTRPLARLEPEQQVQVYLEASATAPGGKLTSTHIEQVANVRFPPVEPAPMRIAPMLTSKSEEWYTPAHILERVVEVFDVIDLDPCSNSHETPNVPARQVYTKADDGLVQRWAGRVFLNPPYGKAISLWITKLLTEYQAHQIEQAIALIPARTDTDWFWPMWKYPLCFVHGRLKFTTPEGEDENGAPFASAIAYLGTDLSAFRRHFGDLGHMVIERDYLARKGR